MIAFVRSLLLACLAHHLAQRHGPNLAGKVARQCSDRLHLSGTSTENAMVLGEGVRARDLLDMLEEGRILSPHVGEQAVEDSS